MVASDGVWDAHEKMKRVANMSRSWPLDFCPSRMIQVGGGGCLVMGVRGWLCGGAAMATQPRLPALPRSPPAAAATALPSLQSIIFA